MVDDVIGIPIPLNTLKDFMDAVEKLYVDYPIADKILFRGQSDAEWSLETTLERYAPGLEWSIETYTHFSMRILPELESFTQNTWGFPDWPELQKNIQKESKDWPIHLPRDVYKYWVYLRHLGFPSPLLDWSKSPYIAAFFALAEKTKSDEVSIYAFIEKPFRIKSGTTGESETRVWGEYVTTHKRHFLQQCLYLMCLKGIEKAHSYEHPYGYKVFVPYEEVFKYQNPDQNVLIKFTLPNGAREDAIRYLNMFNINHFSLFQTEDALAKTLALKEEVNYLKDVLEDR